MDLLQLLENFLPLWGIRTISPETGKFCGIPKFFPLQIPGLKTDVQFLTEAKFLYAPQRENWRWCSPRLLTMGSGCFTSGNKTLEEDHSRQVDSSL
jgi:hypothetical protein